MLDKTIKERPILFSGEMVRRILDGSKTQTRRTRGLEKVPAEWELLHVIDGVASFHNPGYAGEGQIICPYGKPGDHLYVKETVWLPEGTKNQNGHVTYQADHGPDKALKWTSSRFMPRWASRILLEITDIRVERLTDISEENAKAEGCEARPFPGPWWQAHLDRSARDAFVALWCNINGPDSWNSNPWIWAISFRRVQPCA